MKKINLAAIKLVCLLVIATNISKATPTTNDYKSHLIKYEGNKNSVYLCSSGIKTVGTGINLKARGLDKIYKIGEKIDKKITDKWLEEDIKKAKTIARENFPSFDSHGDKIQIILVSLSFNLGENGINKFVKFKKAIGEKNYKLAAKELKNSKWYSQVGNRARDYVNILNNL